MQFLVLKLTLHPSNFAIELCNLTFDTDLFVSFIYLWRIECKYLMVSFVAWWLKCLLTLVTGIISIIVIQLSDSVMKLKIAVCLLSIFKQLRVVERIEDTIFVLIFFIWDTVLANQNDDVVDADWLHLSSGMTILPIVSFSGWLLTYFFGLTKQLDWPLLILWPVIYNTFTGKQLMECY